MLPPDEDVMLLVGEVVRKFLIDGELEHVSRIGNGHIHDTMLITINAEQGIVKYVLQKINIHVFPDAQLVMDNFCVVTNHLRTQLGGHVNDIDRRVLRHISSRDGRNLVEHQSKFWRATNYIEGSVSFDQPTTLSQLYEASKAFGTFIKLMNDVELQLPATIADFHNTAMRFSVLRKAADRDPLNRKGQVTKELEFAFERESMLESLSSLPNRIVHNDTKVNNVLFDVKSSQTLAVVDLDTVMPGLVCYDYGELIRTASSNSVEDEVDLERVNVDEERFTQITAGFLEGVGGMLTDLERSSLFDGAVLMALENGVRFLTDFLEGDIYFKTARPKQNIDRCRAQFALVKSLEGKAEILKSILLRIQNDETDL